MTLSSRGGLAVADIIFYTPALVLGVLVALRHGFTRQAGWIFLIILSVIRIVGACTLLAAEQSTNPPIGLSITAGILSSVGLSPLLLAMLGILQRLHEGSSGRRIPTRAFRVLQLALIAALALSIVGGIDGYDPTNPQSTIDEGHNLTKAAIIVFTVCFLLESLITAFTGTLLSVLIPGESVLFYAVALSVPLLLVRILYSLLAIFDTSSNQFNLLSGNVTIQACMELLMEFLVVILYIGAGLKAPKIHVSNINNSDGLNDPAKMAGPPVRMGFMGRRNRNQNNMMNMNNGYNNNGQVSGTI